MRTIGASDAERRYLEHVAEDVAPLLGTGWIVEIGIATRANGAVIACRHAFGDVEMVTEGAGATAIDAHADLRQRLVEDRVGVGLRALLASPVR